MAGDSKKVIYAALFGNGFIAITKFAAAAMTGSSAMLSEGVHSLVDTGNQGLLLFGLKRAAKPADDRHPFGYGAELYFWAFVVAILIFSIGAGISIYEGIHKVQHPEIVTNAWVNYVVLAVAMLFEGAATFVAFREFVKTKGDYSYIQALKRSKNPAIFTVLFEDSAAMLGLVIAFIGLFLAQTLNMPIFDGIASIAIGVVLAITAIFLAYETKGLLIGEAATPENRAIIEEIISEAKGITNVNGIITLHLGPDEILVNASLDFEDKLSAAMVEKITAKLTQKLQLHVPSVKRIFIEAKSWSDA
ncbi:MAG: cation diffusion facilitator family transporter [Rickettsiales bacterium]|nr:cation diffusion facilitator family transporter [Rickettsiales bacterium]